MLLALVVMLLLWVLLMLLALVVMLLLWVLLMLLALVLLVLLALVLVLLVLLLAKNSMTAVLVQMVPTVVPTAAVVVRCQPASTSFASEPQEVVEAGLPAKTSVWVRALTTRRRRDRRIPPAPSAPKRRVVHRRYEVHLQRARRPSSLPLYLPSSWSLRQEKSRVCSLLMQVLALEC
jgi:hypothetical protein